MQSTSSTSRLRRGAAPALLGLSLSVALVACGGTDPEGGGDGAGGVTLTLTGNTDQKVALDPIIEAFETENPGTTVDVSYAPVDQLQTALRAQIGAGNAPDVFVAWPGNGSAMSTAQLSTAGAMEPLTDQAWVESVPESLRRLLGDGQDTLMWSPGVGVIGVIYNRDIFAQQGIAEPTTWPLASVNRLPAAALGNATLPIAQINAGKARPVTTTKSSVSSSAGFRCCMVRRASAARRVGLAARLRGRARARPPRRTRVSCVGASTGHCSVDTRRRAAKAE